MTLETLRAPLGRTAAAAWALACACACPLAAHAAEGGVGNIIPGNVATLIDLPPTQPGWIVQGMVLNYKAGADLAVAKLDQKSSGYLLGAFYTFEPKVMGAYYSIGGNLPYVSVDVTADIPTPSGSLRLKDRNSGLGDVSLIPAMLAWKDESWTYSALLTVYAPTGSYDKDRLANPGLNYWTFDPTVGMSYNNEQTGFNAALYAGIGINTRNKATDYTSGSLLHFDASVQQLLPLGPAFVGIGAEAFHIEQVSADRGSGAFLGDFKGRTAGIGPVLSYVVPMGRETLAVELRWLPETSVKNRLEGDYMWFKVVYQF
jgi:hypothetical protein